MMPYMFVFKCTVIYKISLHICRKRLLTRCETLYYLAFVLNAMTLCSLYIVCGISTYTTFVYSYVFTILKCIYIHNIDIRPALHIIYS